MKVTVNRQLSAGYYHVSFDVADFTPDEVMKMGSFGVPQISVIFTSQGAVGRATGNVPLNQINRKIDAAFSSEAEAKKYEETVLAQIRDAMKRLRESEDKFTSSEEVPL